MKSDYSLTITPEIMSVCTSKYEAVLLAALIAARDCDEFLNPYIIDASDDLLSQMTQRLINPSGIRKYLGMLQKKGLAIASIVTTSPDRAAFQLSDIDYFGEKVRVRGSEFDLMLDLDPDCPSDMENYRFTSNGAEYTVLHRGVCLCDAKLDVKLQKERIKTDEFIEEAI